MLSGKYTMITSLKDKKGGESPFLCEKGDTLQGDWRKRITIDNGVVTLMGLDGTVLYRGVNHIDCIYHRFSIRAFIDSSYFALCDRRRERFTYRETHGQKKERSVKYYTDLIKNCFSFVAEKILGIFVH
jgi:hypothetical protein